jgi:hypothetical protein
MHVIPALRRLKWEDSEFQVGLILLSKTFSKKKRKDSMWRVNSRFRESGMGW